MAVLDHRIDDRLIHGQVVGYWIPYYGVDKILIVDDLIVKDKLRQTALKFGTPSGVKLSFYDAKTCADKLKRRLDKGSNVMVLCNGPKALLDMYNEGYHFKRITVGNMTPEKGAEYHLKKTLFLSDSTLGEFKELLANDVDIVVQIVPNDKEEKLTDLLEKEGIN